MKYMIIHTGSSITRGHRSFDLFLFLQVMCALRHFPGLYLRWQYNDNSTAEF